MFYDCDQKLDTEKAQDDARIVNYVNTDRSKNNNIANNLVWSMQHRPVQSYKEFTLYE